MSRLVRKNVIMDAEAPSRDVENGGVVPASNVNANMAARSAGSAAGGTTVPDEDFFSLIMKVQSGRMEDQRAAIPFGSFVRNNGSENGGSSANGRRANSNK